ncbi:PAS domain-containing sensor histidine kinase [Bacillus sp. FJAT-27264]|uniref:ATP-binding protein n=1 Tax=Paenibacillus sp. (strain DSM 101736 / FJAT-27264) TaxID=1850362 RepID=UPI000807B50A|nr:ATP-binding protein [Bacillus sp. FJAT-27264]OBZ15299.1 PAS domain-containing sensor histidine kinase [Bacillus sp. FJAT-27264]
MSIKTKLSAILFGSVLLVLVLNLTLNLYDVRNNLRNETERNMRMTAMQIAVSVEQSSYSSNYVEGQIANNLRMVAILASHELDPDIKNVDNRQLRELSHKLGVSNISLLVKTNDDIVIAKSSDPKEVGLSTRGWGFWYIAFLELFLNHQVTIDQGQALDHFWSGPFEYSTSNPEFIEKWGYYYDGTSNYIIDPYVRSTSVSDYVKIMSPDEIVKQTQEVNPGILEITGINPETFALTSMSANGSDTLNLKLRNRPIKYGSYNYGNVQQDKAAVAAAISRQQPVLLDMEAQGKRVLKSFIPIMQPGRGSYVISVVMDYSVISSVIRKQLVNNSSTTLLLLVIFFLGSYILSGYVTRPIKAILAKVNDVARGKFEPTLKVGSRDELGQLAQRINAMSDHLMQHTSRLGQTLEENRAVKEHLESVINGTSDAIHTMDMNGQILSTNRAFEELYGWSVNESTEKTPYLVPATAFKLEAERLEELKKGKVLPPVETLRLKKDGSIVEVSVSTSVIRDEEGKPLSFVHVSRDMTERNRIEELLRRSEKLTTVGQLAAGVAHEIRNPLTTLRGFLQLQQEKKVLIPLHIELMLSELERINLIVSEFLILSKPQAVHFQQKDVRFILSDVISLLDSQAHLFDIEFAARFSDEPATVHCEENQLKQVFINIVKNAIEAMPQGGTITLEQYTADHSVVIVIADEGDGIPEEMLPKLGEPFFTNKETGTGLGLMVSQRIIQAHKGTMEITSEVGSGAKVTITMPAAEAVLPRKSMNEERSE